MEQLIDLLEENSCLWNVSNKDYYLRKKRERAYKQIEEKLGRERAVIKAKTDNDLTPTMLAVVAFVCMHHATSANNSQHCWAQQCFDLLRPCAWAFRVRINSFQSSCSFKNKVCNFSYSHTLRQNKKRMSYTNKKAENGKLKILQPSSLTFPS